MFVNNALLLLVLAAVGIALVQAARLTEDERVRQWHARGNTWPPTWQPETEAYKRNMELREEELMRLPGANERWENFMQFTAARMVPRFTPNGFKVIQTPPEIQAALKAELDKALLDYDKIREEAKIDVLYTPLPSKFVDIPKVSREVHEALLPLHEEWSGLKLRPTSIYGIRMNRNGSSLIMHYDKVGLVSEMKIPNTSGVHTLTSFCSYHLLHYSSLRLDLHPRDQLDHPRGPRI